MIATIVLAAQYAGTLDVLDTTRVAARSTAPALVAGAPAVSMDVSTVPTARLGVLSRQLECTAAYSPSVTAADVELGFNALVLHSGIATVAWHNHTVRIGLSEAVGYGQLNSAFLYQPPTAPGQPTVLQAAPKPTTIDFASSNTNATALVNASRQVTLSFSGGYASSGGANASAQTVLPEQEGGRGSVAVSYRLSRRDTTMTQVGVQDTATTGPCPPPAGQVTTPQSAFCLTRTSAGQAIETLRHALSRAASLSLGAGASAAFVQSPTLGHERALLPIASATLTDKVGLDDLLTLSVETSPLVDARTGLFDERLVSTLSLLAQVAPALTFRFTASAARSIPLPAESPYPLTLFTGGVEARVRMNRELDFSVGEQTLWQDQTGYGTVTSTIGYVGVTARAPTMHF